MALTLDDLARADAAAIRAWLARCGVTATLAEHHRRRADGGVDYQLVLAKAGRDYEAVRFGLGAAWGADADRALVAGVQTLYPVLDPEGWAEGWEEDVRASTAALRAWLAAVDGDGELRAGIESYLRELDQTETRADALDWLRTGFAY